MLCGQWDCAICGPYLKKKWLAHLIPLVADAESVHLAVVSREDWPKVYRRIRRAGGQFVWVELDDEFAVFTTASEGVVLPHSIRSEVLKVAIDAATFRHKAITTSREWKLTQKDEADSEWERIGVLPGTVEEARQVVRRLGLQPVDLARPLNAIEAFEVTIPESWLENDEQGFKVFVQWLMYADAAAEPAGVGC